MADVVGASLGSIVRARSTVGTFASSPTQRAPNVGIPAAAKADTYSISRATLNSQDARKLLSVSVVSATAIVETLKRLVEAAKLSTHDGLVSSAAGLTTGDATRISRFQNTGLPAGSFVNLSA